MMKEIHFGGHLSKEALNKFTGEIELIEKLSHPNIVQYLHHEYKRASLRLFLTRFGFFLLSLSFFCSCLFLDMSLPCEQ